MADQIIDCNNVNLMPLTTSSNDANNNQNNLQDDTNHNDNSLQNVSDEITSYLPSLNDDSNDIQIKSILKNKTDNTKNPEPQKDENKILQKCGILKSILKRKKKAPTINENTDVAAVTSPHQNNNCSFTTDVKQNEIKFETNKNLSVKINDKNDLKIENEPPPSQLSISSTFDKDKSIMHQSASPNEAVVVISSKPPLPPSKIPTINKQQQLSSLQNINNSLLSFSTSDLLQSIKIPPPRLKRKLDEQHQNLIQKLNACTEQLRLEISELKSALGSERNAVRMLRAQYEAETRKSKIEIKKLQTSLETSKKIAIATAANSKKFKDDFNNIINNKDGGSSIDNNLKLIQEISSLKEANKVLEEKIQILSDAERRKNADIRELKDSYEIRLTHISKSAKTEISRLLEEIKTKERNIGQLKKDINSLKNAVSTNKKDFRRIAQNPSEMKKLKDIERINGSNINNNTNQKCITTTCGENGFHNTPHEMTERIIESHTDIHIFRNKDAIISSDTDSALSSAPQSISPQPPPPSSSSSSSITIINNNNNNNNKNNNCSNNNDMMMAMDSSDIWQSVKNYSKEIDTMQKDNQTLKQENETLKKELDTAKQQINELEKTVLEANKNTIKIQQLTERIKYLENKEDELIKETHELQEQNELLEFRILELEESHEKWSLRSNSNPDTRDMWTDTDRKLDHNNHHSSNISNDHDIIMYSSDHTDSGVTSPHSQHHIDDRNVISPCDISLMDHSANDEVKRRLTEMTKRSYIGEEDKICLLQVLTLINNLETLSEDSILVNDEMISLDLTKSKASDYGSDSSSPRSLSTDISQSSLQKIVSKNNNLQQQPQNSRIVATVLPYSSTLSTPTDSPKKIIRNWNSISLQESGVFEGDNLDSYSQGTQTEPEDFINCTGGIVNINTPTADLCAEIQKLNKFREKIEECTTKSLHNQPQQQQHNHQTSVTRTSKQILSPNLSDQRRLQYYKDRLELLENKLLIYESSGDQQTKRLAERLQREIKLESLVKELQQKVENLEVENLRLEEEKCEFEEAENDTRLRLQRLEIDLEILNQRNSELEMSKEAAQNRLKDAKNQCSTLQGVVKEGQEKIKAMENDSKDLKNRLNLIKTSMPAILLFNSLMVTSNQSPNSNDKVDSDRIVFSNGRAITNQECICSGDTKQPTAITSERNLYLENKVQELMTREKQLTESIAELNRAYHETLENADNLWVQIEKEYKDRLSVAEATENQLKSKIIQLEESLSYNSQCAQERIAQLEESEKNLEHRITKLTKENKDLVSEHDNVIKQCTNFKDELTNLKNYISNTVQENMDREKQRIRTLEEDLNMSNKLLNETQKTYKSELQTVKMKLQQTSKELLNIEVTNSELREEVQTLENEIIDLHKQKNIDDEKIRNLTDELRSKEEILMQFEQNKYQTKNKSLAQEMEHDNKILSNQNQPVDNVKSLTSIHSRGAPSIFTSTEEESDIMAELNFVQSKLQMALNKAEGKTYPPHQPARSNIMIIEHI